MNTLPILPHKKFIIEQNTHNTTSWIGHQQSDPTNIKTGQTFIAPCEADLEAIEIFTSLVTHPGEMVMSIHPFDESLKSWGKALASTSIQLDCADSGKWKSVSFAGPHLKKGDSYGFRLECLHSYIGLGEAIGSCSNPSLLNGQEWKLTDAHKKGHFYSFFNLAFRIAARA